MFYFRPASLDSIIAAGRRGFFIFIRFITKNFIEGIYVF